MLHAQTSSILADRMRQGTGTLTFVVRKEITGSVDVSTAKRRVHCDLPPRQDRNYCNQTGGTLEKLGLRTGDKETATAGAARDYGDRVALEAGPERASASVGTAAFGNTVCPLHLMLQQLANNPAEPLCDFQTKRN
jgi:hypothetical protein